MAGSSYGVLRLTGLVQAAFIHLGKFSFPTLAPISSPNGTVMEHTVPQFPSFDSILGAAGSAPLAERSASDGTRRASLPAGATATAGPGTLSKCPLQSPRCHLHFEEPRSQINESIWFSLRTKRRRSVNSSPVIRKKTLGNFTILRSAERLGRGGLLQLASQNRPCVPAPDERRRTAHQRRHLGGTAHLPAEPRTCRSPRRPVPSPRPSASTVQRKGP